MPGLMVAKRRPKTGKYTRYHVPLTQQEIKRLKRAAKLAQRSARSFAVDAILARI